MGNSPLHIRSNIFEQTARISRATHTLSDAVRWWGVVVAMIGTAIGLWSDTPAFSQTRLSHERRGGVQYVLLDTDRVLSGTVLVQGESVIIRRGNDAEVVLRAEQVAAVADDLPQLYEARTKSAGRRPTSSVDTRLSDARWCIDQGLAAHATEALMNVYAVAPSHPVAMQLESRLRRLIESSSVVRVGDQGQWSEHESENNSAASDIIQPVSHSVAKFADESELNSGINATTAPASLHAFTARVQPILISRCGQCHHEQSSQTTNWNLVLPPGGAVRVTQRGSVANLRATIPFCDSADPQNSELMKRALTNHSGLDTEKPPIAVHERSLAYTLAAWMALLGPTPDSSLDADPLEIQWNDPSEPLNPIEPTDVASSLVSPPRANILPRNTERQPANSDQPTRLPMVENPDSVEHFNRETLLRRKFGLK